MKTTSGAMGFVGGFAALALAACGLGVDGSGSQDGPSGADAGAPPPTSEDAGVAPFDSGAPSADAAPPADAAPFDAAPPVSPDAAVTPTCGSTSTIDALLAQYGSGSTASTITPMGTRFESAAAAGPLSAANASFLAAATSNPTIAQATSATGLEWKTVSVTPYPSGAPTPEDISQHAIGDCDGDSALAMMAYVNPALVASALTDHHDGTYSVAMFDPMGKPITVAVDSEVLVDSSDGTSLGQVSAKDGSADWATILEKAVMKYDEAYGMVGVLDGIGSETLVPMFTGNGASIAIAPGSLTPDQMQQVVTVSLAAGKFITGGFNQVVSLGQDETVTAHGYAVMVPSDPASDMVDMRNPWGVNPWASSGQNGYDTSTDGLLHLPLATSPTSWPQLVDLRIIDPGASCVPRTSPFVPDLRAPRGAVHVREPHAARAQR
jgi:hypothetical protein